MYNDLNIITSEQKMLFDIRQLLIEINEKLDRKVKFENIRIQGVENISEIEPKNITTTSTEIISKLNKKARVK